MAEFSWRSFVAITLGLLLVITRTVLGQNACPPSSIKPQMYREMLNSVPTLTHIATNMLRETMAAEAERGKNMRKFGRRGGSTSFKFVQSFLGSTPYGKQLSFPAFVQSKALVIMRYHFNLNNQQIEDLMSCMSSPLKPSRYTHASDTAMPTPENAYCPYPRRIHCKASFPYRTYDGSCNNLANPLWGASFQPLARFLHPLYADAIESPRESVTGYPLPSPRLVSGSIHWDIDLPHHVHTLMVMQFGQFLDHDLSRTAISKLTMQASGDIRDLDDMEDVECGYDGCQTDGLENRACMPIQIPYNDTDFRHKPCLMFVRSQEVLGHNCKLGAREQLNQVTSYLEASHIYGSTKKDALKLRNLARRDRGRLRMTRHPAGPHYKALLKQDPKFQDCKGINRVIKCFTAGDGRVNEFAALTVMHIYFAREHNRIESILHRLNRHWGGERLYQETRRIITAMWQMIIYNEYLPVILGLQVMKELGLTLNTYGYWNKYDATVQPSVANSFATAAMRFGHSQIQGVMKMMDNDFASREEVPISVLFRSPQLLYDVPGRGCDGIMRGVCGMSTQTRDSFITKQVTKHLFADDAPHGVGEDLAALNVQRGRDHGLPGYNHFREWCGLTRAYTFEDLTGEIPQAVIDRFKRIYSHVDDIDIFPAGISEYSLEGAAVGPTFACVLGRQFQRAKFGDRYWFENNIHNPYPFTQAQLSEIRKTSLAKIICNNADTISHIQPRVFLQPLDKAFSNMRSKQKIKEVFGHLQDENGEIREQNKLGDLGSFNQFYYGTENARTRCSSIPDVDLGAWRDTSGQRRYRPYPPSTSRTGRGRSTSHTILDSPPHAGQTFNSPNNPFFNSNIQSGSLHPTSNTREELLT